MRPEDVRVRRNARGSWECRLYLGTAPGNRRVRPQRTFPASMTEEQALRAAVDWAASMGAFAGAGVFPTVAGLAGAYIAELAATGAPWNTVRSYSHWLKCYVAPDIGRLSAPELPPHRVQGLYLRLSDDLELSATTIRAVHALLRRSYRWGVARGLVPLCPIDSVTPPRPAPARKESLTPAQAADVAEALLGRLGELSWGAGDPAAAAPYMAALNSLATGLRVGEECALRPCDVDFRTATLHVDGTVAARCGGGLERKPPKSKNGVRALSLGAAALERLGRWARATGRDRPPDAPLFPGKGGGWMRPAECSVAFSELARRIGLPGTAVFHVLRHTHASILLAQGAPIVDVAQRLGDTQRAVEEYYAHAIPGSDRRLADSFDRALGPVRED